MKVLNIQVNYLCYVGAHRRDWWFFNYRLMRGDHNSHYTKDIRALAKGPFKYKFDKLIQPVSYQILRWFVRLLNGRLEKAVCCFWMWNGLKDNLNPGKNSSCKPATAMTALPAAATVFITNAELHYGTSSSGVDLAIKSGYILQHYKMCSIYNVIWMCVCV